MLMAGAAHAQVGCVPNPNLFTGTLSGAFVNGCPIPASSLNALAAGVTGSVTSPLTVDSFQQQISSVTSPTANAIYRMATSALVNNFDTHRSVGVDVAGTTVTNVNQYAAYQLNNNPLGAGATSGAGVLYFGMGVAAVNNAAEWGINTNLTDNTSQVVTAGTGKFLQNEFDFNVTSPNTTVNGLFVAGASLSQPALAQGFRCRPLGTGIMWTNCFSSDSGTAINALVVGANAISGANVPSQFVAFNALDGAGAPVTYAQRINAAQKFEFTGPPASSVYLFSNGPIQYSFYPVASLPTCNAAAKYQLAGVSDNNTAVSFGGALTGGGSNVTLAFCNGSTWVQH
jgi:hypothetical protein